MVLLPAGSLERDLAVPMVLKMVELYCDYKMG